MTRIILKLKANKTVKQNAETITSYHNGFRGWVYNIIKHSSFSEIHDKKMFKPFCFSSILGVKESTIKEEYIYSIIISSPDKRLIEFLMLNIDREKLNIGEFQFELLDYKIKDEKINKFDIIRSSNIVSITKSNNKLFSLNILREKNEFINLLSKNIIRKYNSFNKSNVDINFDLFNKCIIEPISQKFVKVKILVNKKDFIVFGNSIRIKIGNISKLQREILNYVYDLGFGVRNTYGFGFMMKDKSNQINFLDDFKKII